MWLDIAVRRPVRHFSVGGMSGRLHGLVLHVQQGTEADTVSWFNAIGLPAPASAHFGNPKHGPLEQFVDTDNMAWAQKAGNHDWISIENEGYVGDSLTPSQVENVAMLLAWLHWAKDVPLQLADNPASFGLGYHSMGGSAWGHLYCPGKPIIGQRLTIIELAAHWPLPDSLEFA